jgi:hypothetical protein
MTFEERRRFGYTTGIRKDVRLHFWPHSVFNIVWNHEECYCSKWLQLQRLGWVWPHRKEGLGRKSENLP